MTTSTIRTAPASWTGTVPVDDTALAVTDHGGTGTPVLFLNGCFGDQHHWKRVLAALAPEDVRCVLFDARARGRSRRSADVSFAACLRDVTAVVAARGLDRPVLVGWSYGGLLAVHHAAAHPDAVRGVVCVDGGLPFGLTDDAGHEHVRRLFRRLGPAFPVASRLGLAAHMSAAEHAEVNIESNVIGAGSGPLLASLRVPVRYVLASGGHLGADDAIMAECRASLDPALAANPNVRVSSTVASNHSKIVAREAPAIVAAIREVVSLRAPAGCE